MTNKKNNSRDKVELYDTRKKRSIWAGTQAEYFKVKEMVDGVESALNKTPMGTLMVEYERPDCPELNGTTFATFMNTYNACRYGDENQRYVLRKGGAVVDLATAE